MREKKHLERDLMENKIFTEAVPTTLIMIFLVLVSNATPGEQDMVIGADPSDRWAWVLFYVTFSTSVLSAGLGLAKCLNKVGVCQTSLNH